MRRRGVLLVGRSGTGKSEAAIQLINGGAKLLGDDRLNIRIAPDSTTLKISPVESIAGIIHSREQGFIAMDYMREADLFLIIMLGICRLHEIVSNFNNIVHLPEKPDIEEVQESLRIHGLMRM